MILNIQFPDDLKTEMLLTQSKIPCFCMVAENFEIRFDLPLPEVSGVVSDWDRNKLEERSPAGGGGHIQSDSAPHSFLKTSYGV